MWIKNQELFVTHQAIRANEPNRSLPDFISDSLVLSLGYSIVRAAQQPEFDPRTQGTRLSSPIQDGAEWQQSWEVFSLSGEARLQKAQEIQAQIVAATQARLDSFAQTRNYDSILSACTYASSGIPKFAAEGQCAVNARDATWAALYTLMGEVQAGTRPMPTGYSEVEPLLPALAWPV